MGTYDKSIDAKIRTVQEQKKRVLSQREQRAEVLVLSARIRRAEDFSRAADRREYARCRQEVARLMSLEPSRPEAVAADAEGQKRLEKLQGEINELEPSKLLLENMAFSS